MHSSRSRLAVGALLLGTGVLYMVGLDRSGWANAFYAAAAQAGASSWHAWFFGATDAPGSIMIDKPPASVWLMGLSARLFGVNSWAVLAPQALLGVGAVGLLYLTVARWHGRAAGLAAGVVLALTPVATLMFRFDNPDALLVFLLVAAAYAVVRAVDAVDVVDADDRRAGGWWLVVAGTAVGLGFLTKSLQAFLVLPGFAAGYLAASTLPWPRRLARLALGGLATLVSAGWWVAVVELWPAGERPYVGGSQRDSVLELIFGYNGFGRLTGDETGSAGGGFNGGSVSQLFDSAMATQASWLLPVALAATVVLAVLAVRTREPRLRATVLVWGGWLLVTGAVFSLSRGVIHAYYTVALAPAIAALVAVGGAELVRRRARPVARLALAVGVAGTGVWAWVLLGETPDWQPWLRAAVLAGSLAVALGWLLSGRMRAVDVSRAVAGWLVAASLVVALAAPAAYSVQTASTAHTGALPTAGPGGHGPGGPTPGGPGGRGTDGGGTDGGGTDGRGVGGRGADGGGTDGQAAAGHGQDGFAAGGPGAGVPGGPGERGPGGGMMVLLTGVNPSAALSALLRAGASGHTWVAATVGSEAAAGYQLAAGAPVMAVGGFNGTDPSPTLAEFQSLAHAGAIHWFIDSGLGDRVSTDTGGSDQARQITEWVRRHYAASTVDGTTLYDLTTPAR